MLAEDSAAQLAELERMTRPGGVLDHWAAAGVRDAVLTLVQQKARTAADQASRATLATAMAAAGARRGEPIAADHFAQKTFSLQQDDSAPG